MILTANCEKHRERVNISGKKVRPEILNSKINTGLNSGKISGNFSEEIEKPFLAFIGQLYIHPYSKTMTEMKYLIRL